MDTASLPTVSIDVGLLDKLTSDPSSLTLLSSTDAFQNFQRQSEEYIKRILPNLDLSKLNSSAIDPLVESSYAFKHPHSRPIETLPKTIDEFKNVFPNFVPPSQISIVPAVSSLQASRTLHEDSKKELTPLEKLLDQNFKEMHSTIQQALSAARKARIQFDEKILTGPIHPYQKLIYEYLGPNFKSPSVFELELPQTFCPVQSLERLNGITDNIFQNTVTHFQHLTAGIGKLENEEEMELLQGLGHAFATLSATDKGSAFVVDRKKTAEYLEFAETVRNIPIKEIVNNPVQTAQRIINRLIQILESSQKTEEEGLSKISHEDTEKTTSVISTIQEEISSNESLKISPQEVVLQSKTTN